VRRLRKPPRLAPSTEAPRTVAIFPLDRDLAALGFARELEKAFKEVGLDACAIDRSSASRPIEWFNALEEAHDIVLYEADFEASQWSGHCLRQADRLVLLADATRPLTLIPPALEAVMVNERRAQIELVLYRKSAVSPSQTLNLLRRFEVTLHHHIREGVPQDLRRFARMITGRAIGVVLSGGGARGMSHVGVIRALRESGFELDLFGGTSMGSIVAAGAAIEWNDEELRRHMREAFFDENPVSDYTVPLISLVRGRKTTRFLRTHLLDRQIEDAACTYFCVSANLTAGELKIHRTGPMWLATRASVAIPGVLPPVIEGSDILVDGGMLNNLPVDIMSAMRRGPIVAVDVTRGDNFKSTVDDIDHRPLRQLLSHARRGTPNILTLLVSSATLSSSTQARTMHDHVDLLIEPPLAEISMLNWKAFNHVVEAGYQHAMEILEKRKGVLFPH
jgi:NTE family protein